MKGILYKEEMFKATIKGRKRKTRRIINIPPESELTDWFNFSPCLDFNEPGFYYDTEEGERKKIIPLYKPVETVYLKEPFYFSHLLNKPIYKYNTDLIWKGRYINKLFMPEKYARYFIKILNVKAEHLKDISDKDAIAEGIKDENGYFKFYPCNDLRDNTYIDCPITSYYSLWTSIHGKGSWHKNPWVFVYEFELTEKPQS